MSILWFLVVNYILLSIALYLVFKKAGEDAWKGLVPGLNFIVWCKLIGRKSTHAIWLLVPIVNLFVFVGMAVDMVRSFGKYKFWHSAAAVIYAPLSILYLGLSKGEKYLGPTLDAERNYHQQIEEARAKNDTRQLKKLLTANPYKKSAMREWVEAIVFAVFAAAFIRMFLIEAYTIPTPSMEGSLLVGDFLFVSKAHYGIRTPKTVVMFPLLHNRIPMLDRESYLSKPNLPFRRLPALESIDRNDPVVFNFPDGDSVYVFPERTWSVNDFRRGAVSRGAPLRATQIKSGQAPLVVRPVDKKDHYIKRCIAIPGDTLQIRDRQVYINGQAATNPKYVQFITNVRTTKGPLNQKSFTDWGISADDILKKDNNTGSLLAFLNQEEIEKLKTIDAALTAEPAQDYIVEMNGELSPQQISRWGVDEANFLGRRESEYYFYLTANQLATIQSDTSGSVKVVRPSRNDFFPYDPEHFADWTNDNYGPIWIPKKGVTVTLTPANIAVYRRIISNYEGNKLEERDGKYIINGQQTDQYTFKMDYYWMMGDNRHNSEDSRVWGFVPDDHIVGKPLFIWFSLKEGSLKKGINWGRIFTGANKM